MVTWAWICPHPEYFEKVSEGGKDLVEWSGWTKGEEEVGVRKADLPNPGQEKHMGMGPRGTGLTDSQVFPSRGRRTSQSRTHVALRE